MERGEYVHVDYRAIGTFPLGATSCPENDCQQVEVLLARTLCAPMLRVRARSRDTIRVQ